jgi:hypothetical protein
MKHAILREKMNKMRKACEKQGRQGEREREKEKEKEREREREGEILTLNSP